MNRTIKSIILLALATAVCFGQTALSTTTLSSAIATPNTTSINLSTTGMLSSGPANQINTVLYVDRELMAVVTVVDSTHALVRRGINQTRPFVHASGASVWFNPNTLPITSNFFANQPTAAESWGSCLTANEQSLPKVYVTTGDVFDCKRTGAAGTSGQWVWIGNGTMAGAGKQISAFCTGSLGSAETEFLNGAACSGATTSTARFVVGTPGTLANLYVVAGTNVTGGTNKDVLTVFKNGSGTAVTCTFATGGAATTCSDTTHSVAVVAGDVITFQFVTATSDTGANIAAVVGLF